MGIVIPKGRSHATGQFDVVLRVVSGGLVAEVASSSQSLLQELLLRLEELLHNILWNQSFVFKLRQARYFSVDHMPLTNTRTYRFVLLLLV